MLREELVQKIDTFYKEVKTEGMNYFKEAFKAFFEAYPEVEEVSYTAYTPVFNDGDVCNFRSHHNYPEFDAAGKREKEYSQAWRQIFAGLGDDALSLIFGKEVKVTVTPEGITTEEYYDMY